MMKSAVAMVAAGVLLLAGCQAGTSEAAAPVPSPASPSPTDNGVADLPATDILAKAQKAIGAVKSFRLTGFVHDDGTTYKIDLRQSGDDLRGSAEYDDWRLEVLRVGGQGYLRMNEAMLTEALGAATVKKLGARLNTAWIKPDKATFEDIASGFDIVRILKPAGKLTKGARQLSNQRAVITLADAGGDYDELHVATTGEPLPLKIVGDSRAVFSEFDRTFPDIAAPAAKDIVDLSSGK